MLVGLPTEISPDEQRVALVPGVISSLKKVGIEIVIQPGCGERAGFPDSAYVEQNARAEADRRTARARPPAPAAARLHDAPRGAPGLPSGSGRCGFP